jgi:hypothetical protein
MTQIPKNPFDREDWFSEVVKSNDSIMNSSQKAFLQFQTKYNPQSMTSFQKVLTFFTTHTITAVVTASICLGGIATFAAQQVAPEQYKPTTVVNNLFKNNKIQQTNPNTPLVSDVQNDVVSYDPCNISIKYPKQLAGEKIIAVKPQDFNLPGETGIPNYFGINIMSQKLFSTTTFELDNNDLESAELSCSKNVISPLDNNLNSTMTTQDLADLTGWFITGEQKLEEIRIENQATSGPFRTIYFRFNNTYYKISFVTKKITPAILNSQDSEVKKIWNNIINKPGIFGDQIQIQFNNVAKNVSNVEILKLDNVPTGGFLFEYDKKLELKNKDKFEFVDPSKNNTFYVIKDKAIQDKITKLGLNIGDSIIFSGQVTNSNSTINITKKEEYTITKLDNVVRSISEIEKSNLDSTPKPIVFEEYEPVFYYKTEDLDPSKPNNPIYYFQTKNKTLITIPKTYFDKKYFPITDTTSCSEKCPFMYAMKGTMFYTGGPGGDSYSPSDDSFDFGFNGGGGHRIFTDEAPTLNNENTIYGGGIPVRTDTVGGIIRSSGPGTEEKNGMIIQGELFVPRSQSVRATESIDEYTPRDCDIVPLKSYANNSNGMLFVTNAKNYTANGIGYFNSTPLRLNQLKDYIKTGKGEISNAINAFHSGCGGFATQSMKELGYTNKNNRQVRAVMVAIGQEAIADAMVYLFVQQGDKFAMMNTNVYSDVFERCKDVGYGGSNPDVIKYQDCMQGLMKNDTNVEKVAKEKMQELLSSFEID